MTTLLRARRVSGRPVVDAQGIVVGVVSEADLLTTALERGSLRARRWGTALAALSDQTAITTQHNG
jgi:CBS domain-containing protein